jgi:hypothetical protein
MICLMELFSSLYEVWNGSREFQSESPVSFLAIVIYKTIKNIFSKPDFAFERVSSACQCVPMFCPICRWHLPAHLLFCLSSAPLRLPNFHHRRQIPSCPFEVCSAHFAAIEQFPKCRRAIWHPQWI